MPVTHKEGDRYPLGPPEQTTDVHCLTVVSDDERYRNFQSLFRRTRARCMGVTVNHWLVEFDSLMRSQVVNGEDAYQEGHRTVTPWSARSVGVRIPPSPPMVSIV
jgi:hypothetical protein